MRHFLFEDPDKEYRIKPVYKRARKEQDSAQALAYFLRKLISRPRNKPDSAGRGLIRNRIDARQKCVVKMQYSNSIDAHLFQLEKYLVKEGKGMDNSQPELYGTDLQEYRDNIAERNFRIFLSPQSGNVDLKDLTEKFMKKLENQLGYKLYWQAANHYDTAHPHAHLLINGVSKDGREVNIPKDVVKTFMREYARDICTSQIGRRTAREMEIEKERELEAPRFTRIDDTIKDLCGSGGGSQVKVPHIISNKDRMLTRLENLRKLGLCKYENNAYVFVNNWEESLKANSRYNTFLQARNNLVFSRPADLQVYTGAQGNIAGKVTKIYSPEDDTSNNHAVIIEGLDGKAYFVPLLKRPMAHDGKYKAKFELKEGGLVSLAAYKMQTGRLTPVIFKEQPWRLAKEIKSKNYTGELAEAILSGKSLDDYKQKDRRKE